jgi:hypothetical protein
MKLYMLTVIMIFEFGIEYYVLNENLQSMVDKHKLH